MEVIAFTKSNQLSSRLRKKIKPRNKLLSRTMITILLLIKETGMTIIDLSECLSSINPGKSMLTPGLPFSEK